MHIPFIKSMYAILSLPIIIRLGLFVYEYRILIDNKTIYNALEKLKKF